VIEPYRRLRLRHWLLVAAAAALLIMLREFLPRGYLWMINLLVVMIGFFIALLILTGPRRLLWGSAALAAGGGAHAWAIRGAIADGRCSGAGSGLFGQLHAWDACIDYLQAGWVIEAQALVLAGALVWLGVLIAHASTAISFVQREFTLWRLRSNPRRRRR